MRDLSLVRVFLPSTLGIVFLIVAVGILNVVSGSVNNRVSQSVVNFLNQNLLLEQLKTSKTI